MDILQIIILTAQLIVFLTGGCPHDEAPKSPPEEVPTSVPQNG